ncbi:sulfatase-like hydrolase/transferase [Haloarcula sp. JP-Z28]|uniref:sulfatase-like hydrolase/transferase n=1 Tax=Haloarcula sp. JP-Z28 TaxID=2716715 RepID=UPI0014050D2C|nr:sulfatase-like hydrolase/transferase [Haloarcula sp. JP-Z28]NHN65742.1 sulfatase-like hydrolase/transferase [Haloarcula sp. JP-Z28]
MDTTGLSNVVLVTVDSLRADAIGAYDAERHTPVMDSIANSGTVFERAFATGNWTPFSFPSILASRPVFADTGRIGVDGVPTLASVLSEADVATGGFNAANGFLTSHWGYEAGFDEFEPFVASVGSSIYSRYLATHPTVEAWIQLAISPVRRISSLLRGNADDRPFLDTSRMFDVEHAAAEFVAETDSPFFLWVHYMDAHTPYVPAPRYIREVSSDLLGTHRMLHAHTRIGLGWDVGEQTLGDLRTLYQAAVRQVDASIGRLVDTLADNDIADETAVVLAGDHGEEFQEHGHLAHYPKLYDELIRVPLVVDVPGADGRRIDGQVGLDAVPPTVADLLDVDAPTEWQGDSLAPSVFDGDAPADEPVVSVTVRGEDVTSQPIPRSLDDGDLLVSVRDRDWTYVENVDGGTRELYYRPSEPTQQDDLSADPTTEERRVIERFESIIDDHAATLRDRAGETATGDVDDDLGARLSALGYR